MTRGTAKMKKIGAAPDKISFTLWSITFASSTSALSTNDWFSLWFCGNRRWNFIFTSLCEGNLDTGSLCISFYSLLAVNYEIDWFRGLRKGTEIVEVTFVTQGVFLWKSSLINTRNSQSYHLFFCFIEFNIYICRIAINPKFVMLMLESAPLPCHTVVHIWTRHLWVPRIEFVPN